jgi:hypothetical protein
MTDTSEPWPPPPGSGPVGPSGTPPPLPPQPTAFPPPQAEWYRQASGTPPAPDTTPPPALPLPADQVVAPPTPTKAPRRRRGGLVVIVALIVVGLAGLLGGGALLAKELTRKATSAEQATALAKEIASRWQRLTAGTLFPATFSYTNGDNVKSTATRVGIVQQTSCAAALDPTAFQQVHSFGCAAMLRATYVNTVGAQAVTVGVAVFPSRLDAEKAQGGLESANAGSGLNAAPIAGTIADTFGNAQRGTGDALFADSYVVLYTAGYTDGLPGSAASANDELRYLGQGAFAALQAILTKHTKPCTMKDIKC